MNLELTDAERILLEEVLQGRLAELREEVRHSRVSSFRDELKEREELLRGLLDRVAAAPAPVDQ